MQTHETDYTHDVTLTGASPTTTSTTGAAPPAPLGTVISRVTEPVRTPPPPVGDEAPQPDVDADNRVFWPLVCDGKQGRSGWNMYPASDQAVNAHRADGGIVGAIPGWAGLTVVDWDADKQANIDWGMSFCREHFGDPDEVVVSGTAPHVHLWYRAMAKGFTKTKFLFPDDDDKKGDIICRGGYVCIYEWDAIESLMRRIDAGLIPMRPPMEFAELPRKATKQVVVPATIQPVVASSSTPAAVASPAAPTKLVGNKVPWTEAEILRHAVGGTDRHRVTIRCVNTAGHKNGDKSASASYYKANGAYYCGGCGAQGFAADRDSPDWTPAPAAPPVPTEVQATAERMIANRAAGKPTAPPQDEQPEHRHNGKLVVRHDYWGFAAALQEIGCDLRMNVRWGRHEYWGIKGKQEWVGRTKEAMSWVQQQIAAKCLYLRKNKDEADAMPLKLGRDTYATYSEALACEREVDPLQEWVLARDPWDGIPRLEGMVELFFEVLEAQKGLARWASTFIIRGQIERCFKPGAKLDELPIFIGGQAIGKSTFVESILPPELMGLFGPSLNLMASEKEIVEAMAGRSLVELSEFVGARKADIARTKAMITRTDDGFIRKAYKPDTTEEKRRCIFVATCNVRGALPNDHTGNRRYVSIELKAKAGVGYIIEYLNQNRNQLWAEALHWWQTTANPSARLPDELKDVQAQENEKYKSTNHTVESIIETALQFLPTPFTMHQLMDSETCKRLQVRDSYTISSTLESLGYENRKSRLNGKLAHRWWPKSDVTRGGEK